jgi:hypothetical protein
MQNQWRFATSFFEKNIDFALIKFSKTKEKNKEKIKDVEKPRSSRQCDVRSVGFIPHPAAQLFISGSGVQD